MKKLQEMALGALMTLLITGVANAEAYSNIVGNEYDGENFLTKAEYKLDAAGFAKLTSKDDRGFYGYYVGGLEGKLGVSNPAKYTIDVNTGEASFDDKDAVLGFGFRDTHRLTFAKDFEAVVGVKGKLERGFEVRGLDNNAGYGLEAETTGTVELSGENTTVKVTVTGEEAKMSPADTEARTSIYGIYNHGAMYTRGSDIRLQVTAPIPDSYVTGIYSDSSFQASGNTKIAVQADTDKVYGIYGNKGIGSSSIFSFRGLIDIKLMSTNEKADLYGIYLAPSESYKNYCFILADGGVEIDATARGTAVYLGDNASFMGVNASKTSDANIVVKGAKSFVLRDSARVALNDSEKDKFELINIEGDVELQGDKASFSSHFYDGDRFKGAITKTAAAGASNAVFVKFNEGATWELTAPSYASSLTFKENSVLLLNGAPFLQQKGAESVYALNSVNPASTMYLKIAKGAKMVIKGMENGTYNIAQNTKLYKAKDDSYYFWDVYDNTLTDSALVQIAEDGWQYDQEKGTLKVKVVGKTVEELIEDGVAIPGNAAFLEEIGGGAGEEGVREFFGQVGSENDNLEQLQTTPSEAIAKAMLLGEDAGLSKNALSVAEDVDNLLMNHLSFKTNPYEERGGYGPSLMEEDSGAGIWAEYLHGKDDAKALELANVKTSYKNKYDGVLVGLDFKQVGDYRNGMAFHYVDGDSKTYGSGIQTKNDYDGWGVGYYGGLTRGSINYLFDVNYAQADYDVTQQGVADLKASPDTKLFSVGVRAEKLYENNAFKYVPYVGARFLSVDTDAYTATSGGAEVMTYAPERENIWLVPVGVSMSFEDVNNSGWRVAPKLDLSYVFAFGDTDSDLQVTAPGVSSVANMDYTVMDEGSFLGSIGLEASKGDWSFDLGYSYQKGDDISSDKWYLGAEYSF